MLDNKWLRVNEELASSKIIRSSMIIEKKKLGTFLYKIKCRRENEVTKTVRGLDEMRGDEL